MTCHRARATLGGGREKRQEVMGHRRGTFCQGLGGGKGGLAKEAWVGPLPALTFLYRRDMVFSQCEVISTHFISRWRIRSAGG